MGAVFLLGVAGSAVGQGETVTHAIAPLVALETNAEKTALGRTLFEDVRLSHGEQVSCASCHDLKKGGVDSGKPRPKTGRESGFDTLSVFNAALNYRLNWLGEFESLEEANDSSISDPGEMATTWSAVLRKLRADSDYVARFDAIYGTAWGKAAVLDALVEFQRSLITPDSRFDRFLRNQEGAITAEEEQGYRLFDGFGCIACHQGRNVGGNLLQKFGVFSKPDQKRKTFKDADLGRIAVTGLERDRFVFRVPSLRNVAVTAPYLHDGSVASLEEIVAIMGRTQLGRELKQPDISLIVKFLRTLTGEYQGVPLDSHAEGGGPK
jgi:cytochrome c peroxidase